MSHSNSRNRNGTFAKGVSGNAAGKPPGARNKSAIILEAMFADDAAEIARKVLELAKKGRADAIRLVLDRAVPARKGRTIEGLALPAINTLADTVAAMSAIADALSAGTLTAQEARDLSEVIDTFRRTHELIDIERRVAEVERRLARAPAAA